MSINQYRITDDDVSSKGVVAAPDRLTGTAAENKQIFDRLIREAVKEKYNALLDALSALGVETTVQLPDGAGFKYIRLNSDRVLETSDDGEIWQATGSSGHLIVDANGAVLPQRSRMRFAEGTVEDVNGVTVVHGVTGPQGPQGIQGVQGERGIQGPRGYVLVPSISDEGVISWTIQEPTSTVPESRNIRGPQGVQGVPGAQGPAGAQGPQGVQGVQGVQGPRGEAGRDGADGTSFTILGMYATLQALLAAHPTGSAGDAYAVGTAENNTIYNWNTDDSTWQDVGPIRGPEGPQGPQGEQGVQGIQGPAGPQGPDGPQGIQGVQGVQGPEGPQGPRGYPAMVNGVSPDAQGEINLTAAAIPVSGSDSTPVSAALSALDVAIINRVQVVGKGVNLLRNWYWIGGGSQKGGGQLPVNTRGKTVYGTAGFAMDGWYTSAGLNIWEGYIQLFSGAVYAQFLPAGLQAALTGKQITASLLYGGTKLVTGTTTYQITAEGVNIVEADGVALQIGPDGNFYIVLSEAKQALAVKLELGDTQTLARNVGTDAAPQWVLNDPPPDYGTELLRCMSAATAADDRASDPPAGQAQLAAVEQTSTAGRAYAAGDYLCLNGLLYRVTAAIASGGAITPGTNCTATTLGNELSQLRAALSN